MLVRVHGNYDICVLYVCACFALSKASYLFDVSALSVFFNLTLDEIFSLECIAGGQIENYVEVFDNCVEEMRVVVLLVLLNEFVELR